MRTRSNKPDRRVPTERRIPTPKRRLIQERRTLPTKGYIVRKSE